MPLLLQMADCIYSHKKIKIKIKQQQQQQQKNNKKRQLWTANELFSSVVLKLRVHTSCAWWRIFPFSVRLDAVLITWPQKRGWGRNSYFVPSARTLGSFFILLELQIVICNWAALESQFEIVTGGVGWHWMLWTQKPYSLLVFALLGHLQQKQKHPCHYTASIKR